MKIPRYRDLSEAELAAKHERLHRLALNIDAASAVNFYDEDAAHPGPQEIVRRHAQA